MQGLNPNTPLLSRAASSSSSSSSSSKGPVRNAELRTILLELKAGGRVAPELISRFLDTKLPLKQHDLSLNNTTEQAGLLVALTHLIRGSLGVSDSKYTHSPRTSPANPENTSRKKAEDSLKSLGVDLPTFKAALIVKLEAYASKPTRGIGAVVSFLGVPADGFGLSPFFLAGKAVDKLRQKPIKDPLGGEIKTASVTDMGHRMVVMESNVRWAIQELKADIQSPPT